jgi:hypothetical protein
MYEYGGFMEAHYVMLNVFSDPNIFTGLLVLSAASSRSANTEK